MAPQGWLRLRAAPRRPRPHHERYRSFDTPPEPAQHGCKSHITGVIAECPRSRAPSGCRRAQPAGWIRVPHRRADGDLDAAPYGGARYPIEARLDNRIFATFHLDVGVGDAVTTPPEWLTGQNLLGFAGIPPARAAAVSREQQFAEKIHAYTLPRGERANTRVKDLVDLVLLLHLGLPNAETITQALRATFERRATHPIPSVLEPPPDVWRAAFAQLAAQVGLPTTTLDAAFEEVAAFWRTLALAP